MTEQESNQLRSPERGAFGFGMLFWALAGLIALNILVWREVFLPLLDWLGISWEIQTPKYQYFPLFDRFLGYVAHQHQ